MCVSRVNPSKHPPLRRRGAKRPRSRGCDEEGLDTGGGTGGNGKIPVGCDKEGVNTGGSTGGNGKIPVGVPGKIQVGVPSVGVDTGGGTGGNWKIPMGVPGKIPVGVPSVGDGHAMTTRRKSGRMSAAADVCRGAMAIFTAEKVRSYVIAYICIYMYIGIYVCVCVCVCVYVYVYVYKHICNLSIYMAVGGWPLHDIGNTNTNMVC